MSKQNGMMFSTASRDNDKYERNCAQIYGAPWWHNSCFLAFLTGERGETPATGGARGITWIKDWGYYKFAKYVRMMIRPLV